MKTDGIIEGLAKAAAQNHRPQEGDYIKDGLFFKSDLSLKARGMLCTMLSLPDDWEFSENGLQAILKDGQTSIRSAIKELEAAGFLSRTRERDENGRMGKCVWIVCDYPRFGNPNLVNSNLGNEPQLSTKQQSTDESSTNKKKESTRASYDEIIADYTENGELRSSLMEFVKMRKMKKKLMAYINHINIEES